METFRCPTCLFVLTDPDETRCPSCHKRLGRRRRPIVLGDKTKFATREPLHIDLVYAEREKRIQAAEYLAASVGAPVAPPTVPAPPVVPAPPLVPVPPIVSEPEPIPHTTIFEPSQLDPEMRKVLDDLYRRARAEIQDEVGDDPRS